MGNWNQIDFTKRHRDRFHGPVLEIGSCDYGSTPNFRPLFEDEGYVGLDMLEGPNVDLVLDLTQDFETIDKALDGKRFRSILCLSVLEHCADPFAMARNMTKLLAPGGVIFISVPWAWEFHGYPSDYWRFTPEGLKVLFPDLTFPPELSRLQSPEDGYEQPLEADLGLIRFGTKAARKAGHPGRAIPILFFRMLNKLGLCRWLFRHRYVIPPLMIDMIGVRKDGD